MDQQAMLELKTGLTHAIETWVGSVVESEEWERMDAWVGENLSALMADAAFAVLAGVADVNALMRREQLIT